MASNNCVGYLGVKSYWKNKAKELEAFFTNYF